MAELNVSNVKQVPKRSHRTTVREWATWEPWKALFPKPFNGWLLTKPNTHRYSLLEWGKYTLVICFCVDLSINTLNKMVITKLSECSRTNDIWLYYPLQSKTLVEFLIYDGNHRNRTLAQELFSITQTTPAKPAPTLLFNRLTRYTVYLVVVFFKS